MSETTTASAYEELRPLLFSVAYRMLGTVSDAEDVVQEAFLRLERTRRESTAVQSQRAFLTTVTTRLAIDQLRSARVKRETYFGPWLPEPLLTATEQDPAEVAEMADSLSLSFLVLLETLSPAERAVFLLREVFDYGYDEIAQIVNKSEANCRQIFGRDRVARLLAAFLPEYRAIGARVQLTEINGQPGTLNFDERGRLINVFVFDVADGVIQTIRSIINPDKLAHLGYPLSDVGRGKK